MYVRPEFELPTFVDAAGEPIPYGERWPGNPPDDAYSVTSNLERYAPLHVVAVALIDDLVKTYDAVAAEQPVPAVRATSESHVVLRSVRIAPNDPAGSPLTVEFTSFPGVNVHAGAGFTEHYPSCGCDACDEDPIGCVERLEDAVGAVAAGGLWESAGVGGDDGSYEYRLSNSGGWCWSSGPDGLDVTRATTDDTADVVSGGLAWAPWPKRV